MSLTRTPTDTKTVKSTNIGASPTLQSHPPPKIPPEPEPPDRKSPLPTAPLLTTNSDLDPNKLLPQSFFDAVVGSGTKKKAYSLKQLKEILDKVKIDCKEKHILPLPSNFASEVAHYFPIDPTTHQTLLDHIKDFFVLKR